MLVKFIKKIHHLFFSSIQDSRVLCYFLSSNSFIGEIVCFNYNSHNSPSGIGKYNSSENSIPFSDWCTNDDFRELTNHQNKDHLLIKDVCYLPWNDMTFSNTKCSWVEMFINAYIDWHYNECGEHIFINKNASFFYLVESNNESIGFFKIVFLKKTCFVIDGIFLEYYSIFYIKTDSFCVLSKEDHSYNIDCYVDMAYCNTMDKYKGIIRTHFSNSLDTISLKEDLDIRSNIIHSYPILYSTGLIHKMYMKHNFRLR